MATSTTHRSRRKSYWQTHWLHFVLFGFWVVVGLIAGLIGLVTGIAERGGL